MVWQKSAAELSKIATGIGKVFLHNLKEREKMRQWKMSHLDPRNASRTPSANKEPPLRLRYESPINASPSRFRDHPRPFDYEDPELDRHSTHRSSLGRSIGTLPSYNVVSSRSPPRPGYTLKSSTLPVNGRQFGADYLVINIIQLIIGTFSFFRGHLHLNTRYSYPLHCFARL